jgi:inosine/xanthosine triphosphatase
MVVRLNLLAGLRFGTQAITGHAHQPAMLIAHVHGAHHAAQIRGKEAQDVLAKHGQGQLPEHLLRQLGMDITDPADRVIGVHLIDALDASGYLDADLGAVAETLAGYPRFADAEVCGFKASSNVSEQPRSMQETLRGARNRAAGALASRPGVRVAFGIESGVFEIGEQMFDICACVAVVAGGREAVGWSSAFQIPPRVARHVRLGLDLSQASNAAGLSADPKLGEGQGLIGVLTEGRVDRLAYTRQAVTVCMIGVDRDELYAP